MPCTTHLQLQVQPPLVLVKDTLQITKVLYDCTSQGLPEAVAEHLQPRGKCTQFPLWTKVSLVARYQSQWGCGSSRFWRPYHMSSCGLGVIRMCSLPLMRSQSSWKRPTQHAKDCLDVDTGKKDGEGAQDLDIERICTAGDAHVLRAVKRAWEEMRAWQL